MSEIRWDNLYRVLEEYADYWIRTAQDIIQQNGNVSSGKLNETMGQRREISFNIESGQISVKINLEHYWKYIEEGLKGNGDSDKPLRNTTSPFKAPEWKKAYPHILNWISVKPISLPPDMTDKQFAAAAAHNIETLGTEPHPFMEEATDIAFREFENAIGYAIEEDFLVYIEENVTSELEKIL